ncbi:MAG: hypothetical protein O2894_05330, partial [Planctomycetota bacterium]|nr:hypothetical protein [Planctomycetota bacterium]
LNCALNGSLLRAGFDVRPFPVAGDAGAAWGAASEVSRRLTGRAVGSPTGLHLGHEITVVEAGVVGRRERMRSFSDPRVLAAAVAQRIAAGEIVAVARGRAEFGPRALGHRSLLATPTTTASRDRVNRQKGREAWRPLAPIVREGDQRWFRNLVASPHMILTFEATPAARAQLPGVVHVDGTARVQTVAAHGDTFIRHILDALDALGQPPVVINTSFNRRGEPIVNTAEEAWAAYVAIGADALVLDEFLHERTPGGAIRAEA